MEISLIILFQSLINVGAVKTEGVEMDGVHLAYLFDGLDWDGF